MGNIPDSVQPYVSLQQGADLDGYYQMSAEVSDQFAPGAHEDGEQHD